MRVQKGFTLIELVVVMVILGILAAFAVPRFYDFSTQANIADLNGLAGALNSASVTAHGAALAQGKSAASGESIVMEGSTVALAYGYPDPTINGIAKAVSVSTSFAFTPGAGTSAATYTLKTGCTVTYTPAQDAATPPVVTVNSGSC